MHEPILSPRLAAAAGMVRKGGEICDVGTDHALLPCRLTSVHSSERNTE